MPRSTSRASATRANAARLPGRTLAVASLLALACLASLLAPFAYEAADAASYVSTSSPTVSASGKPAAHAAEATRARARDDYGRLPLRFEPNVGQAEAGVDFISRGHGYALFLKGGGAVLALRHAAAGGAPGRTSVLRMKLVGARPAPEVAGVGGLPGTANYLRGANPAAWRTGVKSFSGVEYRGVYEGIDLVYYGNQRQLEYDFRLAPGRDPRAIRLAFEGQTRLRVDASGDLLLRTAGGEVRQRKPFAYQEEADGRRVEVAARYVPRGRREVGFEVGPHDPARPLVIDPVLAYSTYLGGGASNDTAHGIAIDAAGNAYVTGETISTDFPTTAAAAQTTFGGFNYDAYVTKLNATGTGLVYSTYLGGRDTDQGYDIAVDAGGNAYVVGGTFSDDFPVTSGATQPAFGGSAPGLGGDAFVAKLNASGTALLYSTYLGGASAEVAYGVALDAAQNAYVTGSTRSDNFPLMNPLQPARRGDRDAFVTKLDARGGALVYSTYFGGTAIFEPSPSGLVSASGLDNAFDIAVDAEGRAHVVGETQTTDFPVTPNAFQRGFAGLGAYEGDAYVAKFNAAGDALVYSTYLGGSYGDSGSDIALDPAGHAYVAGGTASVNFPVVNAFQPALANTEMIHDAFVTKLSLDGSALVYSTYLGGDASESAHGIAVNAAGSAYVTGGTNSDFFPVRNAVQGMPGGPSTDAFVTKLAPQGSALVYSTYLGGSKNENGYAVAVDGAGDAYVVGGTSSLGFPTTAGALRRTRNGQGDAFVSKIHVGEDEVTYRISGRVTGGDGSPLAGVDVNIFGGARARTKTSADGTYSFDGLRAGVGYSLTAYSPCVPFTTQNDTVANLSSDGTVDFTGGVTTFSVGGRVTVSNKPDQGFGGVTVKLAGAQGESTATTNGQGDYSFPSVAGCRDYTVTASANNVSFDPPSRAYAYLSQNQNFADFTGTPGSAPQLTNYALASNGGVATASSTTTQQELPGLDFSPSGVINGDRKGLNWEHGGGWRDATNNSFPDWVQVDFNGAKSISEVDVFSLQDSYAPPAEPTEGLVFSRYGVTAFDLLYWDGGAWAAVPGASVVGNDRVWRKLTFPAVTTTKLRVMVRNALAGRSRLVEVEAWGVADSVTPPPAGTRVNAALASNGGVASASSTTTQAELPGLDFSPAGVTDGDRKGLSWEHGGGWRDATNNAYPDWLQVDFAAPTAVEEIGVFSLQDGYGSPSEPTEQTTFTKYGVTSFEAQYWDGSGWVTVPGGVVTNNSGVWRRLTFPAVTTTKVRVVVNSALAGRSRLVEVEAWGRMAATTPPPAAARVNFAAAAVGGVATASSTTTQAELPGMDFSPAGVINGDRKGLNWEHGGGWRDATNNSYPDWVQVDFAGARKIDEVGVFSLQDGYASPVEPTERTAFTKYGVTAFEVQYWDGAQWVTVPGGAVTGNGLVWRKVTFPQVTTTKVRVVVHNAVGGRSRLVEVEARGPAS
ncbi:MAG TPA: SBBP repeat-containing protein [Pyrinomonadaceae bacterium]